MPKTNSKRKYESAKRTENNKKINHKRIEFRIQRQVACRRKISYEYGLPDTAKFFFIKKKTKEELTLASKKVLNHGIVVLIDKITLELLLIARFNNFHGMHPELHELFDSSISTFYLHGTSRGRVYNNRAIQRIKNPGDMRALGWRSGAGVAADVGKDVCHYALNHTTSHSKDRIWLDVERNGLHIPRAKDFWAERFATLSMRAFEANSKIAADANVPSFDSPEWETSANGQVWASSVAITRDNFHNKPHSDGDATPYAFGMFARVNRSTGQLHDIVKNPCDCHIEGAIFFLPDYSAGINFDDCNGIVEMVWNTQVQHCTLKSTTTNKLGEKIIPRKALITRFGSSCQISSRLVNLGKALKLKKESMSQKKWQSYTKQHIKGYDQQVHTKLDKL